MPATADETDVVVTFPVVEPARDRAAQLAWRWALRRVQRGAVRSRRARQPGNSPPSLRPQSSSSSSSSPRAPPRRVRGKNFIGLAAAKRLTNELTAEERHIGGLHGRNVVGTILTERHAAPEQLAAGITPGAQPSSGPRSPRPRSQLRSSRPSQQRSRYRGKGGHDVHGRGPMGHRAHSGRERQAVRSCQAVHGGEAHARARDSGTRVAMSSSWRSDVRKAAAAGCDAVGAPVDQPCSRHTKLR